MKKETYDVTGMSCAACSSRVEKAVSGQNGVRQVSVNLLKNSMVVEYDESALSSAQIVAAVEQAGYRAGVYFNQRFGYEEFDLESLQDYVFWLAEYNDTPSFSYHFQLWQYCNDGRVDGISTDVDLNLAFLKAKH